MPEPLRWLWQPDALIALQSAFGPRWTPLFEVLSLLGGHQMVVFALAWVRWFHGRRLAYRFILAVLFGLAASMIIGGIADTPRPDDPRIRVASQIPISSFPSGHMITAMTIWGTFAAARLLRPYMVAILAILIAIGRIGLGQHYPGDLLGGATIGLAILALVAWLWPRVQAAVSRLAPPQRLTVGLALGALTLSAALIVPENRWDLLGLLFGVALALPTEAIAVGYEPAPRPWRTQLLKGVIGLAGIGSYVALAAVLDDFAILDHLLLPALLALWVLLAAPLLFCRLGWSGTREPARAAPLVVVGARGR